MSEIKTDEEIRAEAEQAVAEVEAKVYPLFKKCLSMIAEHEFNLKHDATNEELRNNYAQVYKKIWEMFVDENMTAEAMDIVFGQINTIAFNLQTMYEASKTKLKNAGYKKVFGDEFDYVNLQHIQEIIATPIEDLLKDL